MAIFSKCNFTIFKRILTKLVFVESFDIEGKVQVQQP